MWRKWTPTKKEIKKWIDQKLNKFVAQENQNPCLSKEKWLQKYLYIEVHEVFFSTFPCELHEWLSKLLDSEPTWKHDDPIVWTLELVKHLEGSDYKVARAIDYWIDIILGGFITEFSINKYVSYSKDEC